VTDMRFIDRIRGHALTLAPVVREHVRPRGQVTGRQFEAEQQDPKLGTVRISGLLSEPAPGAGLLVLVHGLGGSLASPYMARLTRLAHAAHLNTLQLNLRGADLSGEDIYHAGLTVDLESALASADLASYRRIVVLGCSMGGHMVLRFGLGPTDARVVAVASLCAPLDLRQGTLDIDVPARALYRGHLLRALKRIYRAAHSRGRVPTLLSQVEAVRTIRDWDEVAVAPRFGFQNAEHYWTETQVAPHLKRLAVPTRITVARHDPMVLAKPLVKYLDNLPSHVEVHYVAGGHLGFDASSRAEHDVITWLAQKASA